MMEGRFLQIRDEATNIPALALRFNDPGVAYFPPEALRILKRAGFGSRPHEYIFLMRLSDAECHYDPHDWKSRTMNLAHLMLQGGLTLVTVKLALILVFLLLTGPTATHALAHAALISGLKPWTRRGGETEAEDGP